MENPTFAIEFMTYLFPMSEERLHEVKKPFCRRRFLAMLFLAGGGLSMERNSEAMRGFLGSARKFLASLPVSPDPKLEKPMPPTAYGAFLASLGLQHIASHSIVAPHFNRHGSVRNSLPPNELWKNIIPALRIVDRLAGELGERVRINSAYRSPVYNATCPGSARWSQHLHNRALDIRFSSSPKKVAELARRLLGRGLFRGGIGLYAEFTHIDTRGRNADW